MGYFPEVHSIDELKRRHRQLMQMYHPDVGGNTVVAQEINAEYEELLEKLKTQPSQDKQQKPHTAQPKDTPPPPPPPPPKQEPKNRSPQGGEEKKKAEPTSTAPAGQPRQTVHYNLEPEKVPGGYCLVALLVLLGAFVAAILFGWIVSAFP